MYLIFSRTFLFRTVVLGVLLFCAVGKGYGQDKVRKYASRQVFYGQGPLGLLPGSIANAENAVNQDPKTYSTLSVDVGALNLITATQYLDFEKTIPAGMSVTVKLTLPASTLGLVDNFRIQPYTNLNYYGGIAGVGARWRADAAGAEFQGANLLNLLSGKGSVEFTIVPTAAFEGIWIEVGSVVGLGVKMDVYHAYILEDATLACDEKDEAIDVLTGVRAGTVVGGVANATGSVSDPWDIIDGDPATFALMSTGAAVLSEVFHTTIFQTASRPNQVAKVVLQNQGGGLLDLSLLTGLSVQPYLGSTAVGGPINESTLLSLRLLPGESDIYELIVPVTGSFDRIDITMGGILGALENLRIYEVSRLSELPMLDETEMLLEKELIICEDEAAVLTASAPLGSVLKWHKDEAGTQVISDGDSEIGSGITYGIVDGILTITGLQNANSPYTYYVSASPSGCTIQSLPVHVIVNPRPGRPHMDISSN